MKFGKVIGSKGLMRTVRNRDKRTCFKCGKKRKVAGWHKREPVCRRCIGKLAEVKP
jgi:hypothetical protein